MGFIVNDNVLVEKVGNEVYVFNINTSRMFTLNHTGTAIMDFLKDHGEAMDQDVVKFLTSTFSCSQSQAEKDAEEFVGLLRKESIISER